MMLCNCGRNSPEDCQKYICDYPKEPRAGTVLRQTHDIEKLRSELAASQERELRLRGAITEHLRTVSLDWYCSEFGSKGSGVTALIQNAGVRERATISFASLKDALSSTPEPRMLTELRAARDGLAECAADTETHDGCRGCKKDLTRLDAFLESIGENK